MIDCTLREDARHAPAAVMDMWDAYRSIQAKVVGQDPLELGQDPLELGLRAVEGISHRYRKQSKPRAFAQSLCHSQALPIVGAVVRSARDFPATEPRSLSATKAIR